MLEFFNGKLKVFDNVLPERELKAWEDFYVNELTFRRCKTENENENSKYVYFSSDLGYKQNIEIFDYENTIVPHAQKININVRGNFQRSYINSFNQTDKFTGHADCGPVPDDKHFVSTVLFLNPEWDTRDGGLLFKMGTETVLIENIYNRLICFSGDIWHCVQPFNAHRARLTHYCTFSDMAKRSSLIVRNKW